MMMGCSEAENLETEVVEEIVLDQEEALNGRLKSFNHTIPHIYRDYLIMEDDRYGDFTVEMYDTNFEPVWKYTWRNLDNEQGEMACEPKFYGNVMVVALQGVVSVHDLATGAFKWELQTSQEQEIMVYEDVLYVLGYEQHFLVGVDIETGEIVLNIPNKNYPTMTKVTANERNIIAYDNNNDALFFNLKGQYEKKDKYIPKNATNVIWDEVVTSDDSEEGVLVIDGDAKTCWTESVKGYGEKEWLEISRHMPTIVSKLMIVNGNHSSETAYEENAKLKTIKVTIGSGKKFTYVFEEFEYGKIDEIKFVQPIAADYISMTIIEAEPGTVYKNTFISEIMTE